MIMMKSASDPQALGRKIGNEAVARQGTKPLWHWNLNDGPSSLGNPNEQAPFLATWTREGALRCPVVAVSKEAARPCRSPEAPFAESAAEHHRCDHRVGVHAAEIQTDAGGVHGSANQHRRREGTGWRQGRADSFWDLRNAMNCH
jgi:hypothetical protein